MTMTVISQSLALPSNVTLGGTIQATDVSGLYTSLNAFNLPFAFLAGTSKLTYTNTTTLTLGIGIIPLSISSQWQTRALTSTVTVGTGGLAPSTLYYIYAYDNAGTVTLEASATGHVTNSTHGIEVKTGDVTRTLVGMARTDGSTLFADSAAQRLVRAYFGGQGVSFGGSSLNTATCVTVGSWAEWDAAKRVEVLLWSGEPISAFLSGSVGNSGAGGVTYAGIGVDSATVPGGTVTSFTSAAGNQVGPMASAYANHTLAEGYHFLTPLGQVSGGTSTISQVSFVGGMTSGRGV